MRALAELMLAGLDLIHAECRKLQEQARQVAGEVVVLCIAGVLLLAAFGLLLAAVFLGLQAAMGAPLAALLTGLITLVLAGGMLGVAQWLAKK